MSNAVKYSAVAVPYTIKCGNIVIGNENVDYGPTSSTGFYSGIDPPDSGYTIYFVGESNQINARCANDDNELLLIGKEYGGSNVQTITDAITYFATGSTGTTIVNTNYPPIINSGLTLNLFAGFIASYPKMGNIWRDLSGYGNNCSLINNAVWNPADGGKIMLDGINQRIQVTAAGVNLNGFEHQIHWDLNWTIECWMYTHTFDALPQTYKQIYGSYNGCNYTNYPAAMQGIFFFNTTTSPYIWVSFATPSPTGCPPDFTWSTGEVGSMIIGLQNRWSHFTFVSEDATYYKIYVDGVQTGGTKTFDWKNNSTRINTCDRPGGNSYGFGGDPQGTSNHEVDFSQCRIYNRALSAAEILQNYNNTKSRFGL